MKKILILLFILSIIYAQNTYSITTVLEHLQETGYYEIIQDTKIYFGNDISIDLCKSLINSPHCEEVVTIYMPYSQGSSSHRAPRRSEIIEDERDDIFEKFESKTIKNEIKKIYLSSGHMQKLFIFNFLKYYDYLIRNMKESQILRFIKLSLLKNKQLFMKLS